jgi:hypothetical protein
MRVPWLEACVGQNNMNFDYFKKTRSLPAAFAAQFHIRGSYRRKICRHLTTIFLFSILCLIGPRNTCALGPTDADDAFQAYNSAFLVSNGQSAYFREALGSDKKAYFWHQALEIQMVEDAYVRTQSDDNKNLVRKLLYTFLEQNNKDDWGWNHYNDDLGWATMAFVRGYEITGNNAFLKTAVTNWNRAYDRGWDDKFGGGVWWDIERTEKDALSNNPNIITGCHLYEITKDEVYLTKSKAMYNWVRAKLYDNETGGIHEKFMADGTLIKDENVYNMGSFINAANCLHRITGDEAYYKDALKTARHVKDQYPILARSNYRGESSWQDQLAHGLGEFVRDNNLWDTFYPWMERNCTAAWSQRRLDLNITWNDWLNPTPEDKCSSLECVSSVTMLQVNPPTHPTADDVVPNNL